MEAEQLLEEILNIQSVNGIDDEGAVARFIADYLETAGLDVRVQRIDEKHSNVIAVLKGKTDRCILWNGHIDTVPYGDRAGWDTDPAVAVRKDDKIYARGSSDMKSGLAAMVYVLGRIGRSKEKPERTIVFLGSCDEEKDGLGAKSFIENANDFQPELLLIGEPTSCNLGVAQKGCIWLKVKVSGTTSHGAEPDCGANAIEQGFQMLMEFKDWISKYTHGILGNATMQVNMCSGGIAANMTADYAEYLVDIRMVPELSPEKVLETLQSLLKKYTHESSKPLSFEFEVMNQRAAIEIDEENQWVQMFLSILPKSAGKIGIKYFTDASILCLKWKEVPVLLFGPGEPELCHQKNEYVSLSKYEQAVDILLRLCHNI